MEDPKKEAVETRKEDSDVTTDSAPRGRTKNLQKSRGCDKMCLEKAERRMA